MSYLIYSSAQFQWQYMLVQKEHLQGFAQRSLTRLQTNPERYLGKHSVVLGDDRMQFVAGYPMLAKHLKSPPAQAEILANKINFYLNDINNPMSASQFMLVYHVAYQGQDYYAFYHNNTDANSAALNVTLRNQMQPIMLITSVMLLLLFIWQLRQYRQVDNALVELATWADTIVANKKITPPPALTSTEVGYLSHTLNASLSTFSQILAQEQNFARFSSHELRAQVATLSANMEILELIMKDLKPAERKVLDRMLSAIDDMKYQTESLLWLSKTNTEKLQYSACRVDLQLKKAVAANQKFAANKHFDRQCQLEPLCWQSHEALLQIALNNLVRNALQNSCDGLVSLVICDNQVTISNGVLADDAKGVSANLLGHGSGFGIGLELVKRIFNTLDISYQMAQVSGRYTVTFTAQKLASSL